MKPFFCRPELAFLLLAAALPAGSALCADNSAGEAAPGMTLASLLHYEEEEPGIGVYPVRYLVSEQHLRIDDGHAASDFVLLERESATIYSVSHEHGNILVIHRQSPAPLPADLELRHERVPASGAPTIAGREPQEFRYLADGELCYEAVVVPGLMQAAVDALAEYEQLLAGQQAANLENTPVEFRTPCYLSRYIHAPGRHLAQGLPIQVWDASGYRRSLVNFSAREPVPPSLFSLPPEYRELSIGGAAD